MVGVPGRSKGCNTCIQRKVKCDGGQPACNNCKKSNRLCTGYKRPVAFVMSSNVTLGANATEDTEDATITTQGRWRKRTRKTPKALAVDPELLTDDLKAKREAKASATAAAARATASGSAPRAIDVTDLSTTAPEAYIKQSHKRYIYADGKGKHSQKDDGDNGQLILSKGRAMTVEALSQVIGNLQANANTAMLEFGTPVSANEVFGIPPQFWALTGSPYMQHVSSEPAWREQLFPMFLSFHLPNDLIQGCKTTTKTIRSRNWLMNLSEASLDHSPALEKAMTALCMSRVGRKHNNMALVQHSLGLYTEGLRQLNEAIKDPEQQLTDQTLAACTAFSLYEVAECPSRKLDGYHSHHMGGLALLKMRGPDAHISPLGHSLFVFMRMQQFIYALLTRKSSFLSDSDWINRPWSTSAKDPQDKFMDQMYCIPVLLEQTDKISESNADTETTIQGYWDIIGQYHAIHNCLQGWFRDLQAIVAGPLYWPELSKIKFPIFDDTGRGRPFPVAFHFPAFSIGQAMMLFWLISAIVNYQLMDLYKRIIVLKEGDEPGAAAFPTKAGSLSPNSTPNPSSPVSSSSPSASSSSASGTPSSSSSGFSAEFPTEAIGSHPPSVPAMKAASKDAEATCRTVSNNICQSVEYFLQEEMGDVGPLVMMLPLAALKHVMVRMEPLQPCPKGRPGLPGEFSNEVLWVDALTHFIGGKGQQLAYYMDDDIDM
ncbi:c6 zinc finger domain protein [Ophiostoma piceae UAMH 11346]|uniref:C6 zinc finger domain protein n=1 Tax=Ophiostoma piceae (strain UAMH 11346) TaxID=1262450 RepID=S3CCB9_OPHP1|nr:c6 zinc finger domain protein [Ophiostoma piceae UAMH 11346]